MKKQILLILFIGFALGCNSNKEEVKIDKTLESEKIIRTLITGTKGGIKKMLNWQFLTIPKIRIGRMLLVIECNQSRS